MTLAESRAHTEKVALRRGVPDGCVVEPVVGDGFRGEWTIPVGAVDGRALIYFHGGGYNSGSAATSRHYASRMAEAAECAVLSVDYRLAPEHVFPAAVEDAVAAYRHVLERFEARHVGLMGESAGGGLALALVHAARAAGLPMPGCVYVVSAWTDLSNSGASYETVGARDIFLSWAALDGASRQYRGEADALDPLASPLFGDFAGWPPMLIHVGSEEVLLSDSERLAERANVAGVEVQLEVWPEMIHCWPTRYNKLGAARRAMAQSGAWIADHL
jgi:acetyl esterase/lipase